MAIIRSDNEVIGDFDEGGLSAVVSSEARLKRFVERMLGVGLQLLFPGFC